ncbi:MAG: branched-chain amino acid binding protein [Actinomycetia bacterium]|jgi:ABC-type branched-subunit amino acid transport system substrate-binding protein|nr:branched-chain amino acid binding protein [Actinomycetes bacterium]
MGTLLAGSIPVQRSGTGRSRGRRTALAMRTSTPTAAAVTLGRTGPFARQGMEAGAGLELWAEEDDVRLTVVDDGGSRSAALRAYAAWLDQDVDLLVGPYASGLVRAVAPLVCDAGRLLYNHGGSADDLARPGLVSLPAPASTYFDGAVQEAMARQVKRLLVVCGPGRFAQAVAAGAVARASERQIDAQTIMVDSVTAAGAADAAVLVVGRFEEDVTVIRRVRGWPRAPALLAAVAAGLPAFGEQLGPAAEGVLGPVQWWPSRRRPEVGPSGADFADRYRRRTGREPSYVAAQAAAAGYLAHVAHRRGLIAETVGQWTTSTLLGNFALDDGWHQVGHRMRTILWRHGRMVPVGQAPAGALGFD